MKHQERSTFCCYRSAIFMQHWSFIIRSQFTGAVGHMKGASMVYMRYKSDVFAAVRATSSLDATERNECTRQTFLPKMCKWSNEYSLCMHMVYSTGRNSYNYNNFCFSTGCLMHLLVYKNIYWYIRIIKEIYIYIYIYIWWALKDINVT